MAARADADPFVRLTVEFLARTGLRKGEFLDLAIDAVVQIGSAYWLRVPLGKLHNDRYIPLHPQLKAMIDTWLDGRPDGLRSDLLFIDRGRPNPALARGSGGPQSGASRRSSGASRHTNSATRWPPRRSTAA